MSSSILTFLPSFLCVSMSVSLPYLLPLSLCFFLPSFSDSVLSVHSISIFIIFIFLVFFFLLASVFSLNMAITSSFLFNFLAALYLSPSHALSDFTSHFIFLPLRLCLLPHNTTHNVFIPRSLPCYSFLVFCLSIAKHIVLAITPFLYFFLLYFPSQSSCLYVSFLPFP